MKTLTREPIKFKQYKIREIIIPDLDLTETLETHRAIKLFLLELMEKCNNPRMSKQDIKNELFKLYVKLK